MRSCAELATSVVRLVQREEWRLVDAWSQSHLVHADYKPWNLLVRQSASDWAIIGALDWESPRAPAAATPRRMLL